jgi:sialic acid synthase SpsE
MRCGKELIGARQGELSANRRLGICRRSLSVVEDIGVLPYKNIRFIRPAHGLFPKYLKDVLGRKAVRDIKKGTPLQYNFIGGLQKRSK